MSDLGAIEPVGRADELDRVEAWRLRELMRAGYPFELAEKLAASPTVDLHQAVELLAHGCSAATAARILL